MPETLNSTVHWIPTTPEERDLVLKELEGILASYHFKGSKRYPAFLKFVVNAALDGRASQLKERTLGVEVFGRDPNYDTNADPVVRFTAGEVRKRIAQYYHENGNSSRIRIELPLGSYVPEFILVPHEAGARPRATEQQPERDLKAEKGLRLFWVPLLALALGIIGWRIFAHVQAHRISTPTVSMSQKFWEPFYRDSRPVLIAIGTSHPRHLAPESPNLSFLDYGEEPYHHVSLLSAVALAHVAGVLTKRNKTYEVKEARESSLIDIRGRPLILIGATNNAWTMHLVSSLRYRFVFNDEVARIEDRQNPADTRWRIDYSVPFASIATDYAIVARFYDSTTEGPVMVVAGLGFYGTEAASELVESPQYLDRVLKTLPAGWEGRNIELVIKSNVIDNKDGPPVLLASAVW